MSPSTRLRLTVLTAAATLIPASGLVGCAGQSPSSGSFVPGTPPATASVPSAVLAKLKSAPDSRTPEKVFTANRDGASVLAFYAQDSGDVYPVQEIAGSRTRLTDPDALAMDASGNIYTANDGGTSVEVFASGADGNLKPKRVIGGSKSMLGPTEGLLVDASGNLWASDYLNDAVTEYASGAHGDVSPIATIQGGNTGLDLPLGMAMDGQGRLYVANGDTGSILIFAKGANGNASPVASISGGNTGLIRPFSLAFDSRGRLLVADEYAGVVVFKKGATGNATSRIITGLASAAGIAADSHDDIYVADFGAGAVDEYGPDAQGKATPLRTIEGSYTSLDGPNYIELR